MKLASLVANQSFRFLDKGLCIFLELFPDLREGVTTETFFRSSGNNTFFNLDEPVILTLLKTGARYSIPKPKTYKIEVTTSLVT